MAEKLNVTCKILKFEDNPKGGQNVFIECSIGKRTWIKEVFCIYDRPISMEEFKRELKTKLWPKDETDNLRFVKEEADKSFDIMVTRKS